MKNPIDEQEFWQIKRELWHKRRKLKGTPLEYNVALIGTGAIGEKITQELGTLQQSVHPEIRNITLIDKDEGKAKYVMKKILESSGAQRETKSITNIEDYIHSYNLALIAINACSEFHFNRFDCIAANLEKILELAPNFRNYTGSVVIATNLTDVMAYAFAQASGMDPHQIIGLNHTDTYRLRLILKQQALRNISPEVTAREHLTEQDFKIFHAYAIGHHQNALPFLDGHYIKGPQTLGNAFSEKDEESVKILFKKYVPELFMTLDSIGSKRELTPDEKKKLEEFKKAEYQRATEAHTSAAFRETAIAIMNQEEKDDPQAITASVAYKHNGETIFIGLPVEVIGSKFEIKKGFLERLRKNEPAFENFQANVEEIKKKIDELKGSGALPSQDLILYQPPRAYHPNLEYRLLGAGGYSRNVYMWDMLGDVISTTPVSLRGEESPKTATCLKVFTYQDIDYVAIGTSSGVVIRSVNGIDAPAKDENHELLIPGNPSGNVGHVRSIEVIGDTIFASSYHIESHLHTDEEKIGYGLFEANLKDALRNRRMLFSTHTSDSNADAERPEEKNPYTTGPIAKRMINGREVLLIAKKNKLLQYDPNLGKFDETPVFEDDSYITAISSDGQAIGNSHGLVRILDDNYRPVHSVHDNTLSACVTAVEHVNDGEDHIFSGNEMSYLNYHRIGEGKTTLMFKKRIGSVDPTAPGVMPYEVSEVKNIKYFQINGKGHIFVSCENEILNKNFERLKAGQSDFDRTASPPLNVEQRAIHSIDLYRCPQTAGEADET